MARGKGKILTSIRGRVLLAFFLLAFVGVVTSLWNIHLLSGYEVRLERLSGQRVPSLIATYEAARQGEAISKGASGVVLTRDKWTRDAFVDRIGDQFLWLDQQLNVLRDNGVDPELLRRIQDNKAALRNSFLDLAKAVDERNAVPAGDAQTLARADAEVNRLLTLHKYHADRMTYAVAGLAKVMTTRIEDSVGAILAQIRVESWQLNLYALLAIAAAIIVAVFLDLKVGRRVVAIQQSMRAVADGNTREKIPSGGGADEISDMADALGTFVEKLGEREEKLHALVEQRTRALAQANTSLVLSERRLRNLFEVASDWFWETDANYVITYMSPQYCETLGATATVVGQTMFEHIRAQNVIVDPAVLAQFILDLRQQKPIRHFEFAARGPDGRVVHIQTSGVAVFDEIGAFEGYRGAMINITDNKRAEMELRHAQKMQALGNLAGGVAHSFNNIFQPILILSEITMAEQAPDSPVRERLKIVIEACRRGKSLGDRILLFSRQDEPEKRPLAIGDLVRSTFELFRSSVPSTITVRGHFDEDVGEVVADAAQIEALILNLASNAVDAIGGGKGEISVSLTRAGRQDVTFTTGTEVAYDTYAKITVKDTGCGMDAKTAERIFDPFFTTKGLGKGTGLGLSTASGIATMHGGGIKVNSAPGQGTSFDFYLPLVERNEGTATGEMTIQPLKGISHG